MEKALSSVVFVVSMLTLQIPQATVHSSLVAEAWLAWHEMPIHNNNGSNNNNSRSGDLISCLYRKNSPRNPRHRKVYKKSKGSNKERATKQTSW
jgi:hypothetical protein